jgi:hypothetical protein
LLLGKVSGARFQYANRERLRVPRIGGYLDIKNLAVNGEAVMLYQTRPRWPLLAFALSGQPQSLPQAGHRAYRLAITRRWQCSGYRSAKRSTASFV